MNFRGRAAHVKNGEGYHYVASMAAKAKKRILASIFIVDPRFNDDKNYEVRTLLFELAKKAKSGVDVRLIVGSSETTGIHLANQTALRVCSGLGIKARELRGADKSLHTKFVVADDTAFVGSQNWQYEAFNEFHEDSIYLKSVETSRHLAEIFEGIWSSCPTPAKYGLTLEPIDNSTRRAKRDAKVLQRKTVAVTCKPLHNEDYLPEVVDLLKSARKSIQVSMFFMTGFTARNAAKPLVDQLIEARNRGLDVQVLLDSDDKGDVYGTRMINRGVAKVLANAGVDVRFDSPEQLLHSKIVLIDQDITVIGSHNWTGTSFGKYEELSLVVKSKDLNKVFQRRLRTLWGQTAQHVDRSRGKAVDNTHKTRIVTPYHYWVRITKIIDGDTVDAEVALGFELTVKVRFRLEGISAPEIFGVKKTSAQYKHGLSSRLHLESLVPKSGWLEARILQTSKREKYGRWLARLFDGRKDLNKAMIDSGHAKVYGS